MAYSPSRRHLSNLPTRRQIYSAQNRQENFNQTNFSQRSPSIRSPKLNQQSQYTKLRDAHVMQEVKIKLDTVLKHNSQLLNENATLSEMVNTQRLQFDNKVKRDEIQLARANSQMQLALNEMKQQQKIQEVEMSRLLDQISRLHEQKYEIEVVKNNEIKRIQQKNERQMTLQIRNLKKSNEDGKQILQIQIKQLKQTIQLKVFEYQAIKSQSKTQTDKLKSQLEELRSQIKHLKQIQQMQLKQLNESFKQILTSKTKQLERQSILTVSKLQNKVRKLKNDLINKNIQIEQVNRKTTLNSEQHLQEMEHLKQQRQKLLEQIVQIQNSSKQNFTREKDKLIELGQLQKKNMQDIATNQRQCLKSEINKLLTVCLSKTDEIKNLYNIIAELKSANAAEKEQMQKMITALKKRIKTLEQDNLQEIQLLKIKMSQLHEADISGLQKYYENEIILLTQQIRNLQDQNGQNRQKIHKLLQDNDQLRKNFQIELTKYKAKIQDYKVKIAAANLQFREQITSLGTKMQLTSQTLLREAEQKKKGAEFFQTEKKKYHALIESKDKQINTAYQTMNRLKQLHAHEIKELGEEIIDLKQTIDDRNSQIKQMRKQYQQQFEQKSQKLISERQDPDERLSKQNYQLRNQLQKAEKDILQKSKQVQFSQKEIKSLQQQVGLRAGFIQTMQLESSAAIEDERSKMKILMNEAEVAMKDYYEAKLSSREKDNQALRSQLHEKQNDIRQLIVKYNQLEKRLKQLLDAQSRLTEFQKKIQSLGLDQNLVKNIGQLFSRYHKQ